MKRRSFLKIIAGIAIAPLSFIPTSAPAAMIKAPLSKGFYYEPYIPMTTPPPWKAPAGYKRGMLKATWTKELHEDLKAIHGTELWNHL